MRRLLQRKATVTGFAVLLTLLLVWRVAPAAQAQTMEVPYDIHVKLLLKLLSKSRTLPDRLGAEVVLAVAGSRSLTEVRGVVKGNQLLGRPIRVVRFTDRGTRPDIVYVGIDSRVSVDSICRSAKKSGAATVTGVPEFVRMGVALGVKLSPSRRPKIMVNLEAAREEGIDLPAAILKIAEVVDQ